MHANKFERDVQGKLDGMRMTPSAPVWAEVEARIRRERKKRRVFFFWLLAPLLLLGGGAAWCLLRPQQGSVALPSANVQPGNQKSNRDTTNNEPGLSGATAASIPPALSPDAHKTVLAPDKRSEPAHSDNGSSVLFVNAKDGSLPVTPAEGTTVEKKSSARISREKMPRPSAQRSTGRSGDKHAATMEPGAPVAGQGTEPVTALTDNRVSMAPIPDEPMRATLPSQQGADSAQKNKAGAAAGPKDSAQAVASTTETPKAHQKRLQWALEAGGAAAFGARTGGMQSIGVNYATGADSTAYWRGGSTWNIGARLTLPLQGRLRFVTGLDLGLWHLAYDTEKAMTLSSSGNPFGGPGAASSGAVKKTIAYNLLSVQLPLALEWQPAPRLPLALSGGFTVTRLLSAAPEGLRSTQFSLQAGARYRIARAGRHSIELGPQLGIGIRHFTGNNRLVQAGAALRFSF
ncbi:hypothetical protein [Flaviaesturariibacter aridisoli]|uniref:Outer membrane protein beta-barrel domain-containing protein n=1 Tax=Flaviaesturariibacter aridisoli TaxID=2545761 RepID=A0A4R4DZT0_9BACT|nr:hypothetical protein [Flaviaesturariibacter aridisoli]TCZ70143.1 hypothetical protein E0486_11330 [Flaviaesturariibacter aridisoli]